MSKYGEYSDDFYVNVNLNTEMELPSNRETVLHFFEQLKKQYPTMKNFYSRDQGEFVLEEDKDQGNYRWSTVEPKRVCTGYVNPPSLQAAVDQHTKVMELIPYMLSVSPLDCESLNFMFGFDFNYRGNHNQLLAEALGTIPSVERLLEIPGATPISNEPGITFALDEDCRLQARMSVETRTSAYHIRTGEYADEQLSVYLTVRRYGALEEGKDFVQSMNDLRDVCQDLIDNYIIEQVLVPLQQTIAIK